MADAVVDKFQSHEQEARKAEQRELVLAGLDIAFDLVSQFELKAGCFDRIYSSESHRSILGHDPASCNGAVMTLTHLYSSNFLRNRMPELITAFEKSTLRDGLIGEVPLLHADGHEVWFEFRLSLDKVHPKRGTLVYRDITDRRERHRLEVRGPLPLRWYARTLL